MGMREVDAPLPECDHASTNYTARLICGANRLLRDRFPHAILRDAQRGSRMVTAAQARERPEWAYAGTRTEPVLFPGEDAV